MTNDLIERYIYAVTKRLPSETRQDVSKELMSLISDMLEERCGDVTPTEKDIKVVLTELGTPAELAEKYNTDKNKCLIGSPYYSTYIFVLKIVLICMGIGMLVTGIIEQFIENGVFGWYIGASSETVNTVADNVTLAVIEGTVKCIGGIASGMLSAFAVVTLLFAFFYHKNIKLDTLDESIDNLPPVPKNRKKISKADSIVGIAWSIIFAVVFLTIPSVFCVINTSTHQIVPIFDTEAVRGAWYLIVAFALAGIIRETIKLIDGTYTLRVVVTTVAANIVSAVAAALWLLDTRILNADFSSKVMEIISSENSEKILSMSENIHLIFLAAILLALAIDTIVTIVKKITGEKYEANTDSVKK